MGHIVADFIDTGILTADIIKTGILESKNGKSWLDMSTGDFNFGDKVKYENGKFEIIVESSDGGNTSLGDELNNMNNKIDSITHAPTVELTGEQAFLYENNFTGTPTPPSIKIGARVENVENPTYEWYFKRSGETSWTPIANNNYNYYNVFHNNSTIFNNPSVKNVTFKCSVGDVYDEFTIVKVSSGSNGTIGNDGIGITEIQEQYYLSDSQQTLIGGTWQTTAPTWVKGKYIWTRTQFTYSNGNVTTTSPICVTGKDGADGLNGGVSVGNVDVFYYQSTSATSLQGGSWTTTAPTWVNGKYVWSKTITYLDNGTQIESNPVCITGERGQNGIDGINGTNGKDGISTYFFVRYSEFSDGSSMTSTPNVKTKYMGTATTTNNVAPTTPSSYTWTLVKGADGKNGEQGVAGANGSSSYLHIKYSNDGETFTANNGEELGTWIGTYVDTNPTDSSVFSDYNWVRFIGEDGNDAYTVLLSNENHTFPSTYEGNIENVITITTVAIAYKGKTSITPTIGTLPTVSGLTLSKTTDTITIKANTGTSLADVGSFDIIINADGKSFTKKFSWSKTKTGASGSNAEYVTVTGEQVFKYTNNFSGTPTPSNITLTATKFNTTATGKWQYKNASGTWTDCTLNDNAVTSLTLNISPTSYLLSSEKQMSVRYIVGSLYDEISIVKVSDGAKGDTGATGSSGIGINSITEYYAVSSSNTTAPTSWSTTVPTMTATNKYLWNYETITYSNNTTTNTSKRVIGVYGDKGNTGATGATGNGISKITNYYLATSSSSGVTTSTSGWTTSVQSVSSSKKYLWNYDVITYTNSSTNTTTPCIIGAYGDTGASGADAYTIILTNESHTFATQNNGNISSAISTTTQVLAYKGASSITPTIGTLPTVNGLTLSKNGTTITIQANTGTSLADSGSFNIPVTVDGKSFTKTFSWSKSKQGATGATGATGASGTNAKSVDIVASTQVFKSTDGGKTFLPNSIVLTAVLQNVTYNGWQCSTDGGKTWSGLSNSTIGWSVSNGVLTINNNFGLFTSTNTTVVFRVNTNDSKIYDTITLVKLYDVTDIEIGGRNYIRNGKGNMKDGFFKNFNDVTGTYGELTLTSQKTFSNISIADGFVLKCRDYEVGRKMVFSYDIMYTKWDFPSGTNRQEFWIGQRYTDSPTSTDGQWQSVTKHDLPVVGENGCKLNEWYHVSKIITIPKQAEATIGTASSIQFYNSNADVSASFTARFKNVKLEYGTIETDWTPSPEDVDYDINTAINPLIKTDEQLTQRLDNAFSDDVITAYEKVQIASDLREIDAQYDDMTKTVKSYNDSSITGIYNEYKVAYDNLHTVLDPCLESMDTDTELSNSVVKDAFLLYGTYYSHLRSAIDDYVKNSFDTTKSSITSLSTSVDIAISKSSSNEQNLNTIAKHMKFSDEGWLELFATTNGNEGRFKTKITDTKLSFTDNNQEVAYMSNQKLYINYAQINNDLQIGSIVATKSDKGGIVFKWQ